MSFFDSHNPEQRTEDDLREAVLLLRQILELLKRLVDEP